ncbi:helicase/secretion neighborhood TadE-like protein [Pedococcus cremeus]|uniref:Helicase/secretion neighborhood TadE-like protein n=1 Tax=Pedococcus cremeus TaxID=587636 RepID=A0A1H9WG90_9MICO|nr:Rv3654c family TadE-like protein [Pedococcus cremeus]SES32854.1 helicase/secretion neighborhood TadE-like protein [Pedococcus cremeus]
MRWLRSPGHRLGRASPEQGSGTVLGVAAVGAVLLCLLGGLALVAVVRATHTARAAADLSALAGAAVQRAPSAPVAAAGACARAGLVAAANGAVLTACITDAEGRVTVEVRVDVNAPVPTLALGPARARARAGTVP